METNELWWERPYELEMETVIRDVLSYQDKEVLILDQSLFYPEAGGQPGDKGMIMGEQAKMVVEDTRRVEGRVFHIGKKEGEFKKGEKVLIQVDAVSRSFNSRSHSAGHLISAVLEEVSPGLEPVRALHAKKAFIEYKGDIAGSIPADFEKRINGEMQRDRKVILKTVSYEEIKNCPFIPKNPPKNNRPWRIMQIEGMVRIPCGGTHVKSLSEIGPIHIDDVKIKEGNTRIYYSI